MAMNRYGRVYHHSDHHYNTLRFPSADARAEFAEKFEKYHASHDHDGEPPRFENVTAAEANKVKVHDADSVTIDGYASHEIHAYHDRNDDRYVHYRPPTTIAPLVIVTKMQGEFIDSSTLTRHELSEIFMDMPDEDFQNLLKSVERDGFKDPIIRMIDTQVLDGWHRYRAAKELNLLRKLRFRQWNERDEGDPAVFVYARNIERRHLNPGQRAQIVVSFNERYGHGGDRTESKVPNGTLKTREELAKEAGVGVRTIARASEVEKTGRADEVISGEKSASEIIKEETIKSLWEQINPAVSEWKQKRDGVGHASKTMFVNVALKFEGLPANTETSVKVLKSLLWLLTENRPMVDMLIRKQLEGKDLWADDEEELAKKRQLALDAEQRMFAALDEVAPDWDIDDFIAAALDKHSDWSATELPHIEVLDVPQIWEGRYDLLTREIKEPAAWIQQMLDRMAEPTEPEEDSPDQKAFNLALNNAQNRLSWMWDTFENADYLTGVSRETFAVAAAKKLNRWAENQYSSAENYLLEKDYALLKNMGTADLKKWTKLFDEIQDYIFRKAEWITALVPVEDNAPDSDQKEIETEHPEYDPEIMDALWDAFNKRLPKWKAKYAESGYKENDLVQNATETELFDALRSYRYSDRTGPVTAEEIADVTDLMKRASYPYARHLRNLLRGDKPEQDFSEIERCYVENQLRVLRNTLSPLLDRLGADDILHHKKEALTADLYDVFLEYENVPTEREMVIALLSLVESIIAEQIPETLDNEVLCPDDEADRQAMMDSDLVTPTPVE